MRHILTLILIISCSLSNASVDAKRFSTENQSQRYQVLINELRCLVCQNQNLADSNSGLAKDLRNKVASMIRDGYNDRQIIDYLVDRYGNFVLYRPPFNRTTVLLWFGPLLFLLLGGGIFWRVLHRHHSRQMGVDR